MKRKAIIKVAQHDLKTGTRVVAYSSNFPLKGYYRIHNDHGEKENKINEVIYALGEELPTYYLHESTLEFYEDK